MKRNVTREQMDFVMDQQEFIQLYLEASPEIKKAIARILEYLKREPFSPGAIRRILTDCNVDPESMARFNEAYPA